MRKTKQNKQERTCIYAFFNDVGCFLGFEQKPSIINDFCNLQIADCFILAKFPALPEAKLLHSEISLREAKLNLLQLSAGNLACGANLARR